MRDANSAPIRVLVVDDSAVVREILSRELSRDPAIEVVGTAADPYIAREKIFKLMPDVLTLDIEMPRMDGVTFLRKLMTHHPMRVIVLSSLAEPGAQAALDALACGAIEVLPKPHGDMYSGLTEQMGQLIEHIKIAANARLPEPRPVARPRRSGRKPAIAPRGPVASGGPVIGIGASTGGTEALKRVLTKLPESTPGIVAVIHMPEGFTRRFADRLNDCCKMEVREAVDGDVLHSGLVLLARGGQHLVLTRKGSQHIVSLRSGPPVNRHKPSVDVLLHSVAEVNGSNAMGVILTGMGGDGADGLLAMHNAGAATVVQDEATCIVFGMPRVAIERGAVDEVLPVDSIGEAIVTWSRSRARDEKTGAATVEPKS